jgi:hypothetical protein
MNPQQRWQLRMKLDGRCTRCGRRRDGRSTVLCREHSEDMRKRAVEYRKIK